MLNKEFKGFVGGSYESSGLFENKEDALRGLFADNKFHEIFDEFEGKKVRVTVEEIPEKIGRYGGVPTIMMDLDPGTKFYVHNGAWYGEVIEFKGEKHIKVDGGVLHKLDEDHSLDISIR